MGTRRFRPARRAPLGLVARLAAGLALCLGVPVWGAAWAQGAEWREQLVAQLAEEQDCTVSFFSQVSVIRQNDREIIAVRAHCDDQRAFDATRISPDPRFDLRPCGTAGEQSC